MTPQLQTALMITQLALMVGAIIGGWGRIAANFATVRADIGHLSTRLDEYTERVDGELGRQWAAINENAEAVNRLKGWRDAQ